MELSREYWYFQVGCVPNRNGGCLKQWMITEDDIVLTSIDRGECEIADESYHFSCPHCTMKIEIKYSEIPRWVHEKFTSLIADGAPAKQHGRTYVFFEK